MYVYEFMLQPNTISWVLPTLKLNSHNSVLYYTIFRPSIIIYFIVISVLLNSLKLLVTRE